MEAGSQYNKEQFWNDILEIILPIRKRDMFDDTISFLPDFYLEKIETLFKRVVEPEDYKYEVPNELYKEFITRIKIKPYRQLLKEWEELHKEIYLEFYKTKVSLEKRATSERKKKQLAAHFW